MEKVLVEAIARGEKSVVAIARVRKERAERDVPLRVASRSVRPPPERGPPVRSRPIRASFPASTAAGVVVDRRGLILTAYHVLGEESDYYVTTRSGRCIGRG